MPANERRLWWCPKGHIMGEVKKVTVGQHRVRALMLYEKSVDPADVPPSLPALRGKVIGSMDNICCTICEHTRNWIVGEDAMIQLLSKLSTKALKPNA